MSQESQVSQESHGKIKATKRHSDTESLEEETEVVSFLRQNWSKKDTSLYKKKTRWHKIDKQIYTSIVRKGTGRKKE